MLSINENKGFARNLILAIIAIIILVIVAGYATGYRFSGVKLVKTQTLAVTDLPEETDVYVDSILNSSGKQNVDLKLSPGDHAILIAKSGYWPYLEKVTVPKTLGNANLPSIRPYFVMQKPNGKLIGSTDPEYVKVNSLFYKKALPTSANKLVSADGKVAIYVDNGKIYADNKAADGSELPIFQGEPKFNTIQVFDPVTEVRNLSFFKDRSDVIILSIQDGVFALELDPKEVQNLQPIYEGTSPDFRTSPEGIYVKDKTSLLNIAL